jgi:drug/metabolite transporter (DMT)-like permease
VGLGLWNRPVLAFALEATLLMGSIGLYLRSGRQGRATLFAFGLVMLAIQAFIFFGPPPSSDRAIAVTALAFYGIFASVIAWWEHRQGRDTEPSAA